MGSAWQHERTAKPHTSVGGNVMLCLSQGREAEGWTYVGMSSDLLDCGVIKVAGVAHEVTADLVGVLKALKDSVDERELAALPQLKLTRLLAGGVNRAQPGVVVGGVRVSHMLLELDDVAVGN